MPSLGSAVRHRERETSPFKFGVCRQIPIHWLSLWPGESTNQKRHRIARTNKHTLTVSHQLDNNSPGKFVDLCSKAIGSEDHSSREPFNVHARYIIMPFDASSCCSFHFCQMRLPQRLVACIEDCRWETDLVSRPTTTLSRNLSQLGPRRWTH